MRRWLKDYSLTRSPQHLKARPVFGEGQPQTLTCTLTNHQPATDCIVFLWLYDESRARFKWWASVHKQEGAIEGCCGHGDKSKSVDRAYLWARALLTSHKGEGLSHLARYGEGRGYACRSFVVPQVGEVAHVHLYPPSKLGLGDAFLSGNLFEGITYEQSVFIAHSLIFDGPRR